MHAATLKRIATRSAMTKTQTNTVAKTQRIRRKTMSYNLNEIEPNKRKLQIASAAMPPD
jgi:uncharacterized protein YigE (DUF2233 family)